MIKSFAHKGLQELLKTGKTKHIGADYIEKCTIILTMLEDAESIEDLNVISFRFHALNTRPVRYSMRVNKNWRVTFEWDEGAVKVDLEDYH